MTSHLVSDGDRQDEKLKPDQVMSVGLVLQTSEGFVCEDGTRTFHCGVSEERPLWSS